MIMATRIVLLSNNICGWFIFGWIPSNDFIELILVFVLQFLEQKYGYYHCRDCNLRWESAYVWCVQGTNKVSSSV